MHQAQQDLAQVKDIMVHNVEQILSRGERIELLVDKTVSRIYSVTQPILTFGTKDNMATQSHAFRRGARTVRRQQFWRNQRILALSIFVGLVSPTFSTRSPHAHIDHATQLLLYIFIAQFCGAGLNHCRG